MIVEFDEFPPQVLHEDSLKFDAVEWKKPREYVEQIRPYMLSDLMSNVLKTGMDTLEIRDLLGEPYTSDRLAEPGDSDVLFFIYKLGVYREMESSYMDIKFEGNKLKEFHIADR